MSSAPLRVFLSHTAELADYPPGRPFVAAAQSAVSRAGWAVTDMAYFTARDQQPADYCAQQVQQASVYVGLIGFRYGSPVRDQPELSYTELEFNVASEQKLPRLIFLLDEETLLPRKYAFDPRFEERQLAFRERLKAAGVTVQRVKSPDQLEMLILQALYDLREQTDQRIADGLNVAQQPPKHIVRMAKFVNRPPMVTPFWWQDRYVETELIGVFLRDAALRMMTVVGRSGIGKTAMVCRLLEALEGGRLPDDLGGLLVDGIVYLAPASSHPVSFSNLFTDLCRLLPQDNADRLLQGLNPPLRFP